MIPRKDLKELAIKTAKEQKQEQIRQYHQTFNYALETTIKNLIALNQNELFKNLSEKYDDDILQCALKNKNAEYLFKVDEDVKYSVYKKLCKQYGIAKLEYHQEFNGNYNIGPVDVKGYVATDKEINNLVSLIKKYFPDKSEDELIQECKDRCGYWEKFENAEWIIRAVAKEYQDELFKRTIDLFKANGYLGHIDNRNKYMSVDCAVGEIDV